MPEEIWLPVLGYEGEYEVSSHGRVRGVPRRIARGKGTLYIPGGLMKGSLNSHGYPHVNLKRNGVIDKRKVHRLVADAFVPKVAGKDHINHKDGDKTNPHPDNLEWTTPLENTRHAIQVLGKRTGRTGFISDTEVADMRRRYALGELARNIASRYGRPLSTVEDIVYGRRRKARVEART